MAPERGLEKFRYVVLDKQNASRGTAVGNVLLCYQNRKQASTDSVTTIGDFELWNTVGQVNARVEELKAADAAGGGVVGVPSPTGKEGFIKSIDNIKRSDLHHFTANWEELLAAATPPPPSNPLVGKSFEMPFLPSSCLLLQSGSCARTHGDVMMAARRTFQPETHMCTCVSETFVSALGGSSTQCSGR